MKKDMPLSKKKPIEENKGVKKAFNDDSKPNGGVKKKRKLGEFAFGKKAKMKTDCY